MYIYGLFEEQTPTPCPYIMPGDAQELLNGRRLLVQIFPKVEYGNPVVSCRVEREFIILNVLENATSRPRSAKITHQAPKCKFLSSLNTELLSGAMNGRSRRFNLCQPIDHLGFVSFQSKMGKGEQDRSPSWPGQAQLARRSCFHPN